MKRVWRRACDGFAAGLARLMLQSFFREVVISGMENLPRDRPALIVANHVNSLVDPMLLIGFLPLRPRVLAKSTLWSHPFVRPFLALVGALPVYRRGEAEVSRNSHTFASCVAYLAAGGTIALFPEGTSHNCERLQPLKTGAARIALAAQAAHPELGLQIVPVGLHYEAKDRFRSRVLVRIGPALEARDEANPLPADRVRAVRALMARLQLALGAVVNGTDGISTSVSRPAPRPLWSFPLAVAGLLLDWLPFKIPGWIAARITRTRDEAATYKLFLALVLFPTFWLAESLAAALIAGWPAALAIAALGPLGGLAALRCHPEGLAGSGPKDL